MAGHEKKRTLRKDRTGMNPFTAGVIVLVLAGIVTYAGFAKHVPFTHGFRFKAVFMNANEVKKNSFVRIAGVNVGKVVSISRYKDTNASVVEMEVQDKGLPIHSDAELKIRPADLPRRQLLRGSPARLAVVADDQGRATRSRSPRPRTPCSSTRY